MKGKVPLLHSCQSVIYHRYEPIPMVDHNDECSEDEEQPASSAELPHKSFEIDQGNY